jgi:cholesterol transport system auxiliary component
MNTNRVFARGIALLLVLCMAACGLLPKKENIQVFAPQVKVAPDASWPTVSWQLSVARPSTSKLLDTSRMVVSPMPDTLQVYQAASWTDSVPDLLETVVADAFEDSGKVNAATRQATAVRADFLLLLDIRHFEAVYADPKSPPNAVVEINAKLLDTNGHVVAAHTFSQSAPASSTAIPAVAHAFDSALTAFTSELVGWTLNAGQHWRATTKSSMK